MQMPATMEQILETLQEFRKETYQKFDQIDRRFEQVDERFEQSDRRAEGFDRRFEQIEIGMKSMEDRQNEDRKMLLALIHEVKTQQIEDHKMIMDIWASRERVTVNFSRSFLMATSVISIVVSAMVSTSISLLF